ncbi:LysE/ArgO family amino acid transporter [Nocardioides sp. YIM 152588]|uniref:LysE/ArgO family amino acid transporter n=1 Tax=Nocardioides sp. YIM 152588 TaxID=3158259 RepID=UPI0032E4DA17
MWTPLMAGFVTGGSLIVAIGAQNAFVLRQGLRRQHVVAVITVCAASDAVLILSGAGGIGSLLDDAAWVVDVARWLGVAFLLWYAVASLRRAARPQALGPGTPDDPGARSTDGRLPVIGRTMALTWLNPHVYLDTVLLLGSIAVVHAGDVGAGLDGRWWFAIGATAASVAWFTGLGLGARALAPLLAQPRAWQVLEVAIAGTMLYVAVRLALG